jgi:YfiH family protein
MTSLLVPDWPAPARVAAGTTTVTTPEGELPDGIRYLKQVHGTAVTTAAAVRESAAAIEADAVTGNEPGDICAICTADCLPVLFCTRDGSAIGAAHAGWRGLAAGVLENTVAAMAAPAADLLAWIGPGISQPNFEVGDEVRAAFVAADAAAERHFRPNSRGRWQADLSAIARQRLASAGIGAVYGENWCTYGDPRRFYSYRRDPGCGRLVSFILLK